MGHVLTENRHGLLVDARLTQATGYAVSQRRRKQIEEVFGWMFTFSAAAHDLVRLRGMAAVST